MPNSHELFTRIFFLAPKAYAAWVSMRLIWCMIAIDTSFKKILAFFMKQDPYICLVFCAFSSVLWAAGRRQLWSFSAVCPAASCHSFWVWLVDVSRCVNLQSFNSGMLWAAVNCGFCNFWLLFCMKIVNSIWLDFKKIELRRFFW